MVTRDIPLNRDILIWARETANLSTARAANKAKIYDLKSRGNRESISSEERLERWEQGIDTPTFSQLEKLAKAYRRPVLTFFLDKPPIQESILQDFRTIANKDIKENAFSPEFSEFRRKIEALQITTRDLLLESGNKELSFVGSITHTISPVEVAKNIRDLLNYPSSVQKKARSSENLFSSIRNRAEEIGIFILLVGNLGSYHTDFEPEVFRGISISDDIAPFIIINPHDVKVAMVFTLIHELCHVLLGDSAISNWNTINVRHSSRYAKEIFCNNVSAEFLVPQDNVIIEWNNFTSESVETRIEFIAKKYNVSRIVVARRFLDSGYIEPDFYWNYYNTCQLEWEQIKDEIRKKEDNPPYSIRTKSRLGNKLIHTIIGASNEGKISELQASRILNVKIEHFAEIFH